MVAKYEVQVSTPLPKNEAIQQAQHVLNTLNVSSVRAEFNTVRASFRISGNSWGEKFAVGFTDTSEGTSMRIISKCAFPLQFFDWGKNKQNVNEFIHSGHGNRPRVVLQKSTVV